MIAMEVAEDDIGNTVQGLDDLLSEFYSPGHLHRMREQTVPQVAQGKTRIDDYPPFSTGHQATHAADTQGFRGNDFKSHKSFPSC
jgi:hypothetical protein